MAGSVLPPPGDYWIQTRSGRSRDALKLIALRQKISPLTSEFLFHSSSRSTVEPLGATRINFPDFQGSHPEEK